MADPEMNDEQAVSAAEQVEHWARGLKQLGALIRHAKDARKDLPTLQETLTALRGEQASALEATAAVKAQLERERAEYDAWKTQTAEARKALAAEVAAEQTRLAAGLQKARTDVAALTSERDDLSRSVQQFEGSIAAGRTRVAELAQEAAGLAGTVRDLKAELAALKKKHGLTG